MSTKKKAAKKKASKKKTAKPSSAVQPQRRTVWMSLSKEELDRPGGILLAWLIQTAIERGLQMQELAAELGVTPGYISQLRTGHRLTKHVSDEFAERAAKFLGVPRIAVLLAAGRVQPEDFLERVDTYETDLERALRFIEKDPKWGPLFPVSIFNADNDIKRFVVFAYEEATGATLIPKVDVEELSKSVASLKKTG